jgi:hypothetical protein
MYQSLNITGAINYVEFGVAKGKSMRWWLEHNQHPDSIFIGFDTFTGLPEQWKTHVSGTFSTDGAFPSFEDQRCELIKGLFQDTLPGSLDKMNPNRQLVLHMDADLYLSTLYPLVCLSHMINPDDIIIFDEFSEPIHEFRAFIEFIDLKNIKYKVLGKTKNYTQVAIKVL